MSSSPPIEWDAEIMEPLWARMEEDIEGAMSQDGLLAGTDPMELLLAHFAAHQEIRARIWDEYGQVDNGGDLLAELDWMDFNGHFMVQEYRDGVRRQLLRRELQEDSSVTERVRRALGRAFDEIDADVGATEARRRRRQADDFTLVDAHEHYLATDHPVEAGERMELILSMLSATPHTGHVPGIYGRLLFDAHAHSSFINVFVEELPTSFRGYDILLQQWLGVRHAVEWGHPKDGPRVWQEIHDEIVRLIEQALPLNTQDLMDHVDQYTGAPDSVPHWRRVRFHERAVRLSERFPDNEQLQEVLGRINRFNEGSMSYDVEALLPLPEEHRRPVELALRIIAREFEVPEAIDLFSQAGFDSAVFLPSSIPRHRPTFFPELDPRDMRLWDPRLLEALVALVGDLREGLGIRDVLQFFQDSIRERVRDHNEERDYLTYADVRRALDALADPEVNYDHVLNRAGRRDYGSNNWPDGNEDVGGYWRDEARNEADRNRARARRTRRGELQLLLDGAPAVVDAAGDDGPRTTRSGGRPPDGRYANQQALAKRRQRRK